MISSYGYDLSIALPNCDVMRRIRSRAEEDPVTRIVPNPISFAVPLANLGCGVGPLNSLPQEIERLEDRNSCIDARPKVPIDSVAEPLAGPIASTCSGEGSIVAIEEPRRCFRNELLDAVPHAHPTGIRA